MDGGGAWFADEFVRGAGRAAMSLFRFRLSVWNSADVLNRDLEARCVLTVLGNGGGWSLSRRRGRPAGSSRRQRARPYDDSWASCPRGWRNLLNSPRPGGKRRSVIPRNYMKRPPTEPEAPGRFLVHPGPLTRYATFGNRQFAGSEDTRLRVRTNNTVRKCWTWRMQPRGSSRSNPKAR